MLIVGLLLEDGTVQPLARSSEPVSNRELRSIYNKFRTDSNVVEAIAWSWQRLYSDKREATQLPVF